jgi:hypothetical protein
MSADGSGGVQGRLGTRVRPFGCDAALQTAFVRGLTDGGLGGAAREALFGALEAVVDMHAGHDDAKWAAAAATEVPRMLAGLPSSQAAVSLCATLTGGDRLRALQQAAAATALLSLHRQPPVRPAATEATCSHRGHL